MTMRSWPYSTASPGLDEARADDAVRRARRPPAGCPACRPSRAGRPPGPSSRRAPPARGWKMPTAGELATAGPSERASRALPGPVAAIATRTDRGQARDGDAGRRAGSGAPIAVARTAFLGGRRRARRHAGPAQPDAPAALADLELAQTRRPELRDERGQELRAQAVDGGVIGRSFRVRAVRPAIGGRVLFGHWLDLLAGRRFVARPGWNGRHRPRGDPGRAGRATDPRGRARRAVRVPASRSQCRTRGHGSGGSACRGAGRWSARRGRRDGRRGSA